MRRYRGGSKFVLDVGPYRSTIDRNDKARILALAEGLERSTKGKGKRSGCLGLSGLQVLRCLLLRFLRAGKELDPSYSDLQRATGLARATISKALTALEQLGILKRCRRIGRAWIERLCPVTGELVRFLGVVQMPSLLMVRMPASRFIAIPTTRVHRAAGKINTGAPKEEASEIEASFGLDVGAWRPLPKPTASVDWRNSARLLLSKARSAA